MNEPVTLTALPGIGEIVEGDDLAARISDAIVASGTAIDDRCVVVVAQKIVSKSEGRRVFLDEVEPSARALEIAAITRKDPALVECVLRESSEVLRVRTNVLIVRHRLGYVVANAGIDQSNVFTDGRPACLLLPVDPEATARGIRKGMAALLGAAPAVIVSDSFGRPWRRGVVNVALGASGLPSLVDCRGRLDRYGRVLHATEVALADALAAAAGLVMGEEDQGTPVVVVAGMTWSAPETGAATLIRPLAEDLFR